MTLVADAIEAAISGQPELTVLTGPSGAGKTATVRELTAEAQARSRLPITITTPAGALDTGAWVVSSVVNQLGGRLQANSSWRTALERTRELLEEHPDAIVICDEPSRWAASPGYFTDRAQDAADLLIGTAANWPSVIVDRAGGEAVHVLPIPAHGIADLRDRERWEGFADAAQRVSESRTADSLDTPLAQRLAVAIESWAPDSGLPSTLRELAERLAEVLAASRGGKPLWAFWQRLALSRVRLPVTLRQQLGEAQLGSLAQQTVELTLLDGGGRLHDELRRVAPAVERRSTLATWTDDVHTLLFEFHVNEAGKQVDHFPALAAAHAAEARHHAGELGDAELVDLVPFQLADELNAVATRSDRVHDDQETAAAVYRRAVSISSDNSFAQRGRARALDLLGEQPREVGNGYRTALALDPGQLTWHADLIAYLLSRGRIRGARTAWAQAESAAVDTRTDANGYDLLHLRIATHLIALAELEFAEYVLHDVPQFAQDAEYRRLINLLHGRSAAEQTGGFVPATRSGREWWRDPPSALTPRDAEGRTLSTWSAGRIDSIEESGAIVNLAAVQASGPPLHQRAVVTPEVWVRRCLDSDDFGDAKPGRFIELGRYRGPDLPAVTVIRLLTAGQLPEPRHMPLPAARWIIT